MDGTPSSDSSAVPEGYARWDRTSAFLDLIGPIWVREDPDFRLGVTLDRRHVNRRGSAHGGALASIADVALGYAAARTTNPPTPLVTVSLTTDFLGAADVGAWVEFVSERVKVGSRMAFSEGAILADGRRIARTSAIFAVQRSAS